MAVHRHEPAVVFDDENIIDSRIATITVKTPANGNVKDVEDVKDVKLLEEFWRTLEMPLINCEINLILTWSTNCAVFVATKATTSRITDTKLYKPAVIFTTSENSNLLKWLKLELNRTTNWNK